MAATPEHATTAAETAMRVAPSVPITVTGLSLWGVGMQDIVYILTAILTVLMVVEKVWKMYRTWKAERDDDAKPDA